MKGKVAGYYTFARKDVVNKGTIITLHPPKTLKVVTRDAQGNPLQGAKISLSDETEMLSYPKETNSAGEAIYTQLFAGAKLSIVSYKEGYYFKAPNGSNYLNLPSTDSPAWTGVVEISMGDAKRTQTGTVVDANGKPAAKVRVSSSCGSEAVTDANGEFVLKNLPDEKVDVYVSSSTSHGSASVDKDTTELVIKLKGYQKAR